LLKGSQSAESIENCRREIVAIEAELLAGNPDVQGLCLALSDWSAELRIIQNEERRQAEAQRRGREEIGGVQALTE
jgi:hypothetical protein